MSSDDTCKECGTAIPADSPGGFCAQCLLKLGLNENVSLAPLTQAPVPTAGEAPSHAAAALTPVAEAKVRYFGDYELLEEIARGLSRAASSSRKTGGLETDQDFCG